MWECSVSSDGVLWESAWERELELGLGHQHTFSSPSRLPGAAAQADVCQSPWASWADHTCTACQVMHSHTRMQRAHTQSYPYVHSCFSFHLTYLPLTGSCSLIITACPASEGRPPWQRWLQLSLTPVSGSLASWLRGSSGFSRPTRSKVTLQKSRDNTDSSVLCFCLVMLIKNVKKNK